MSPFLATFALGDSRVHVGILYSSNVASYIKAMINKNFSRCTALGVSDVDPHNNHVRFGRYFDDSWFGSQKNVIEKVCILSNCLDYAGVNKSVSTFNQIRNTYYFQIRF